MDLNRLSKGERIAGISAIVLFILSFVPLWASFGADEFKESANAWSGYGFTMTIALILTLAVAALVLARAAGALDNVNLPAPMGLVYTGAGVVILLIMLLSLATGPEGPDDFFGVDVSDRGVLLFVGLLLAAAIALGGFLHMKEEGSTPAQLGNVGRGRGPGGPGTGSGPSSGPPPGT